MPTGSAPPWTTSSNDTTPIRATPWSTSDAPENYIRGQRWAIVGIEVTIERAEGKVKLSQNRSAR